MLTAIVLAAAAQPQLLAVLEFKNRVRGADKDAVDAGYFSNVVRSAALEAVPGLSVMTKENMLVLLKAAGKDAANCEGECEVDTGRKLGADFVISGDLLKIGKLFKLDLRMHETAEGRLVSGAQASGATVEELDGAVAKSVSHLLEPLKNARAASTGICSPVSDCISRGNAAYDQSRFADALPLLKEACGTGRDSNACERAALIVDFGKGTVAKDEAAAVPLYRSACDLGAMMSCYSLGIDYRDGLGGLARDNGTAVDLFQKACDNGYTSACNDLGVAYATGNGRPKDEPRGVSLYERSCNGNSGIGCRNFASHLRDGTGIAKDAYRSQQMYKRGCDLGDQISCQQLSAAPAASAPCSPLSDCITRGNSAYDREQFADALPLLREACNTGRDGNSCERAALILDFGKGTVAKDEPGAVPLYRIACDQNMKMSCRNLGVDYRDGVGGVAKDPATALTLFKHACDLGEAAGCNSHGAILNEQNRHVEATPFFVRACDGDWAAGCGNLGWAYDNGWGVPKDEAKAATFYEKACNGDAGFACRNLAIDLRDGIGVPKDVERARALFKKGCDLKDTSSCTSLQKLQGATAAAASYTPSSGCSSVSDCISRGNAAYDAERFGEALPLLRDACNQGRDGNACERAALILDFAKGGVAKDEAGAVPLYRTACDANMKTACRNMGVNYRDGLGGMPKDPEIALSFFLKACNLGEAAGCNSHGAILNDQKKHEAATPFFIKACDGGWAAGCGNLGWAYDNGWGVPKDESRAATYYEKGCDGGAGFACRNLGIDLRDGIGVSRDVERAKVIFRKGCDLNDQNACNALQKL